MLETIKDFFIGFIDILMSIVDFLISFVEDIVYVVKLTGAFVAKIPVLFSWLPAPAVVLIVSIFAIVVVYKILGREG